MNRLPSRRSMVIRRALRHMTPGHLVQSSLTRRALQRIANKLGFVYFGYVSQKDDEHRLVRGHTVSSTHIDNHYSIGTLEGYDTALVTRNDVIVTRSGKEQRVHWLIATFDLHTQYDVPHMYIGHTSRDEAFLASYLELHPILLGVQGEYPRKFLEQYTLYTSPAHALAIESIITPECASVIADRFRGVSMEIEENILYLYIESQRPSEALIEKMLENGLWLAHVIDAGSTLANV